MAETIKGINIVIGTETTGLDKALSDVNKKSKDVQSELKQVEKLLKLDPNNTELVAQKQQLLANAVQNTKEKLEQLKAAQEQVEQQFKSGDITEGQYRAFQREVAKTEQELKSLENALKNTNNSWKDFGDKAAEIGKKTTDIGKGMSKGLTAPILAVGVASQVAWKEVDDALDTITTKTGATGKTAEELGQIFENVASKIPTDLQTAGNAVGEVNTQFGLMGQSLEDASIKVIKFAAINNEDVSQSAINAKQAIEAYGLSANDLGSVLDAMTKTAQNTGQTTTELFSKVTAGAPQIKALGLNFAQATELIGRLEQKGLDSGKALSYLSKAQVTFAKDGKTLEQGLEEITKKIQNSKSETEALTIASEAFGTKGATFMVDAIKRGALSLEELADSCGAVEDTFDATLDPIDEATVSMNNLKLVGAKLGSSMQQALAPVLEKIVSWLQKFTEWFGNLSEKTRTTIVVVGGIVAALGPLLIIIGQVITALGAISTAIGAFGGIMAALASPIGIAIAAVAAFAAGVYLVIKNWESIKEIFAGLWTWITEFFGKWGTEILALLFPFIGIPLLIYENWDKIKEFFGQLWDSVIAVFKLWGVNITTWITTEIPRMISNIYNFFNQLPGKIGFALGYALGTLIQWGLDAVNWVYKEVPKIIASIIMFFAELPGKIATEFTNVMTKVSEWGAGIIEWVVTEVPKFITKIVDFFKELPGKIWSQLTNALDKIKNWISDMINTAKVEIPKVISKIVEFFSELPGRMLKIGEDIVRGLWNGIGNMTSWIKQKISDFADGLINGMKKSLGIHSPSKVMMELGKYTAEGMAIGITQNKKLVEQAMKGLSNEVTATAKDINVSGASSTSGGKGIIKVINKGTLIGTNGMREFANMISKIIGGEYGLSIGGGY